MTTNGYKTIPKRHKPKHHKRDRIFISQFGKGSSMFQGVQSSTDTYCVKVVIKEPKISSDVLEKKVDYISSNESPVVLKKRAGSTTEASGQRSDQRFAINL